MTNSSSKSASAGGAETKDLATAASEKAAFSVTKLVVLVVFVCITATGLYFFRDSLTLDKLADRESELRSIQQRMPWLVYAVALLIYAAVTGFSIPGAAALTLVYGWYFGLALGTLVVSFASTLGATIAFLLSRYLLSDFVQAKFGDKLTTLNNRLKAEGNYYLFTLRLIPAVPFFVINLVMGLTPIRVRDYWLVSQLGMLPGTLVYVYAGASVPNLTVLAEEGLSAVFSPDRLAQLTAAFVLLGVFPLALRFLVHRLGKATVD